ncbi:MAG TPA: M48 family metallopeptidase [Candidatus Angelobacter sp.]|nr:M48 family metallopeptidase [Candidatus Angelobacter sp.]
MQIQKISIRALALVLALLLTQPFMLAQSNSPQLPDPGSPGMNKEQQEQVGLQAAGEVYKQMPVLPDSSPETRYVQQLGKKLAAVIPQDRSWPYQFHVIPSADINAFALPGGPIFVNLATITAADNESQLAGVLAHEMSHVYMQHSAKQVPKANVAQIIAGLAGAVLPQSGLGNLGRMGIQLGAGTMLMKYSRKDEAQADAVGAIIMYRAGYNPKAMADFFQKLEEKYGSGGPQFLSDHPNPGNRTEAVAQEIRNWPPKNYAGNSSSFTSVKEEASKVKAYSAQEIANGAKSGEWAKQNQKNGATPPANVSSSNASPSSSETGNQQAGASAADVSFKQVKPSSNFTQLQQPNFTIYYPDNWKTNGDQNTTIIAPESGSNQTGIAYGVILGTNPSSAPLDDATKALAQSLQQDNPGMRIAGDVKQVEVNGVQGRSIELAGNSPLEQDGKPLPERDLLVTVPRPQGGLMYVVFVSPARDFEQLHPTYQKILNSLQLH